MSRSLIIFGNGLGMALNPKLFSLETALEAVWNDSEHLSIEHKELILSAIEGTTKDTPPQEEEQLDQLQIAIISTEFLSKLEVDGQPWLSEPAKNLPSAFKTYIHEVALYFHRTGEVLPDQFIQPLSDFIKETKSHVVTLNYDNLLYDALLSSKVLKGYSGTLIDGFHSDGFNNENLSRRPPERLGWYMHLHGSPLFIGNEKVMGVARDFLDPQEKSHIVLTHIKHKPSLIAASQILLSYWQRLEIALKESDEIVLFGYSGCDTHLNDKIKLSVPNKSIRMIEWQGAGKREDRKNFWKERLGTKNLELLQLENILEFTAW